MKKAAAVFALAAATFAMTGCSPSPQEAQAIKDKQHKAEVAMFKQNGFEIVGLLSERYVGTEYALNCYTLKKIPDNGITYTACIDHNRDRTPRILDLQALEKGPNR
jgi:hypothetical protein